MKLITSPRRENLKYKLDCFVKEESSLLFTYGTLLSGMSRRKDIEETYGKIKTVGKMKLRGYALYIAKNTLYPYIAYTGNINDIVYGEVIDVTDDQKMIIQAIEKSYVEKSTFFYCEKDDTSESNLDSALKTVHFYVNPIKQTKRVQQSSFRIKGNYRQWLLKITKHPNLLKEPISVELNNALSDYGWRQNLKQTLINK